MTVSALIIVGTIDPPSHQQCKLAALVPQKAIHNAERREYNLETAHGIIRYFRLLFNEETDHYFWKERTIFYMIVCPHIISMAFWPKQTSLSQVIRIENQSIPVKLNSEAYTCSGFHSVYDRHSIENSIASIENQNLQWSLRMILHCFLNDSQTNYLVLTLLNNCNTPFSWGWKKQ